MQKNGRRAQFEREALPHLDALYNSALGMTRDPSSADDLIQETYLKAWRFWDQFKPGTSCKAWLFRIMTNTYINQYRRWSREPYKVDFDDIEEHSESRVAEEAAGALQQTQEAIESLFSDEVKAAVEGLAPYFRVVLLLSDVEGFKYQEVADILDIPIGTVRSRLSRARAMLQEKLSGYARERGLTGRQTDGVPTGERSVRRDPEP